jgi:hypothetical protein
MAKDVTIGGSGSLFYGEDKVFRLELLDTAGLPVNMAGWVVKMAVRVNDNSADPPIFDKTAAIDGTFNAVRASNTQRATVTLTDTEMLTVSARTYRHAWKRMTEDNETVLAYGPFVVQQPAVW